MTALDPNSHPHFPKAIVIAAGTAMAVALGVRIAGAQGELWLDEIWSFHLIDEMRRGAFWGAIATDNNHYLNTLYLWLVGPDAPPLAIRALSILLGTATVGAAGCLQRRRGAPAMLATMALFALAYPMVNAGSEARGYAGMMLCTLLSLGFAERALETGDAHARLWLGVTNAIGVLFQPIMLGMIAALGLWVLLITWRERRSVRYSYKTIRDLFGWTVRLLIPIALVIDVAVTFGGYVVGAATPFSPSHMVDGIAQLFRFLLGLPGATPEVAVLAIVLAIVGLAVAVLRREGDRRVGLYLILIFVVPAAMALAHLPNTEIPRYYLLPGVAFLLLLGDLLGRLQARGGVARALALAALALILFGNLVELKTFIASGRGDLTGMLARIVGEGPGPITSNLDLRDAVVIRHFLRTLGIDAPFVAYHDACSAHPRWILTSDPRPLPDQIVLGAPDCALRFDREAAAESWGLSGLSWTLYRAE